MELFIRDSFGDNTLLEQLMEAGFKGNVAGIVRLNEIGIIACRPEYGRRYPPPTLHSNILSFAKMGLAGDAEALVNVWRASVPPSFAEAHLALLDGNRPATPRELANSIIAAYQVKEAAPTTGSA